MTTETGDGHLWPTAAQLLLLTAAVDRGARAREAFATWRQQTDIAQEFDWQMVRLLPAVYANLSALGETDALMARLKGVYRRAWVETNLVMQRAETVVAALASAGVPAMLLKGAAMVHGYYPSRAHRPMSDVDLAVPLEYAPRAMAELRSMGWRSTEEESADRYRWFHALQFVHPDGGELDLQWRVMVETTSGDGEDLLWSNSERVAFAGHEVRVLAPSDLLLHTVTHGVRWNQASPVRWCLDVQQILARRGAEIDWVRLLEMSARLRVSHRLYLGLSYLSRHLDVDIPSHILASRRACPPVARTSGVGGRPFGYGRPSAECHAVLPIVVGGLLAHRFQRSPCSLARVAVSVLPVLPPALEWAARADRRVDRRTA